MNLTSLFALLAVLVAGLMPTTSLAQSWALPKDSAGWSILHPSADSRLIYVSTSGNDLTAQRYSLAEVGPDPRNPSITVNAYRTVGAAVNQMRDGYADWVMLKAGDTFPNSPISIHALGKGRNSTERHVITYYGESSLRPVIKNTSGAIMAMMNGRAVANGGNHNWAIIGIEWYQSNVDPESPDYNPANPKSGAASLVSGGSNILFEDCVFRYHELVIQGLDGRWSNIELRRNIFTDVYFKNSCDDRNSRPSSVYVAGVTNYLIEENVSDHAGWNAVLPNAGRNQFNHGFYIQSSCAGELYFRGNIISRASANAVQNRSGGVVEANVSIQCPTGIFTARDTSSGNGAKPGITTALRNVVLEGLWMGNCPQSSGANWGMPLDANLEAGTIIQENIIAHNVDKRGNVDGIQGGLSHVTYIGNIVYDFGSSDDRTHASWSDPDRTPGSYNASIGGDATTEAYIDALRTRSLQSWPHELSAYALIDYIREGFNLEPISADYAEAVPVTEISTNIDSLSLEVEETAQISATVLPANAIQVGLTWHSSNESVATVSASGVVTALAAGSTIITLTTVDGGFTDTVSVTVTAPQPNTWAGFPMDEAGNVNTGSLLGWILIQGDYVFVWDLEAYVYLPQEMVGEDGAWTFLVR